MPAEQLPQHLSVLNQTHTDNWAKTVSPNPNVKVLIGASAASSAAGSGYVDASTITAIIQQTRSQYLYKARTSLPLIPCEGNTAIIQPQRLALRSVLPSDQLHCVQ
ncbi:hypothetical protein JVT61DRAFT_12263 [Boletus reticuloceps]|uniref:Uncharacterized protein n=1 Tax=Boletus reticuloceps TaxID=495285 RepID=A0A8I3A546_9AGAM|nr:hypothetical protein JVT61DRAFT_12263 [Boletus reticuloceps]